MRILMRGVSLLALAVAPLRLQAQESIPPVPVDTPRGDTAVRDTAVLRPPEPTADQLKYLGGLRTVARGVAQLRSGVDGVTRAEASKDTARLRRAGSMLGGLCSTAGTFMKQGRGTMKPTVYEDSARVKARNLVVQIDSLLKTMPACDSTAGKAPTRTAGTVLGRLRSYETALQEFRTIVATPVPPPAPIQPQRQ
jgi:hypothetical protein